MSHLKTNLSWEDGFGTLNLEFPTSEETYLNESLTYGEDGTRFHFDYFPSSTPLSPLFGDPGDGDRANPYWDGWDWSTVCLVIVLSSLIVVTIVGNLLVCLSVVLVRKLRKPQNYLLVSLALSDLFVAMFVMPFAIVFELHGGRWPLNYGLCDLWVSADVLCCTASILNLCGISLDRYRAITTPLEYSAKTTPRRMMGIIFVVWLLSACVSLPPVLLLGNVHTDPKGESFCSVSQDFWYQIYATIASFYAPLLVMLVVYFKILRVVADKKKQMSWKATTTTTIKRPSAASSSLVAVDKKDSVASAHSHYGRSSGSPLITVTTTAATPTRNGHSVRGNTAAMVVAMSNGTAHGGGAGNNNVNNNKQQGTNGVYFFPTTTLHRLKKEKLFGGLKEHKASTVLGIIMTAFIVCWLPFFILAIMRPFLALNDTDAPVWVWSVFNWLGYSNSALNPLIYATLNRDFRRPFKEILCFRCATLDSLMRREFYHQQYGDDKENVARKLSRAHVAIANASALDDSDQIHDPVRV